MAEERMTRAKFLEELQSARREWDELVAQVEAAGVGDERSGAASGEEGWLVKDEVAHVAWHDREMVTVIRERALVGSELWELPTHARNARIWEQNRARPWPEIAEQARQAGVEVMEAAPGLTDAELNEAGRFREMPAEWEPWKVIASNTYEHYREHMPALRAALERRRSG